MADVRLVGDDKDRAVGAVVPARYADGDARRTGIATALLWLLPGFLAAVLAAGGGALLVNGVRRLLR